MNDERRRQHLGPQASAAVPLLWALCERHGWSIADLSNQLAKSSGVVARFMYGDRKASRALAAKLADLGVPLSAWEEPLPHDWSVPHAA